VLPGFAVGEVSECRFYSGGFNHTYQVKTGDGRTYYLRAYRIQWRRCPLSAYLQACLASLSTTGASLLDRLRLVRFAEHGTIKVRIVWRCRRGGHVAERCRMIAPLSADSASRAYSARYPFLNLGAGCCHVASLAAISSSEM